MWIWFEFWWIRCPMVCPRSFRSWTASIVGPTTPRQRDIIKVHDRMISWWFWKVSELLETKITVKITKITATGTKSQNQSIKERKRYMLARFRKPKHMDFFENSLEKLENFPKYSSFCLKLVRNFVVCKKNTVWRRLRRAKAENSL